MNRRIIKLATALLAVFTLNAQKPPKGFEKVDQEVVISTLRAQMKYDIRSFSVKPGARLN